MGLKCPPGCKCGKHKRLVREEQKCQPGCMCNHHSVRKCEPNCKCGRHLNSRLDAPDRKVAKYKLAFLETVPGPYLCRYCQEEINYTSEHQDPMAMVLTRVNGVHADTAVSNLKPAHRNCASVAIRARENQSVKRPT